MALSADDGNMCPRERKAGEIVVERRGSPALNRVTLSTIVRELRGRMRRICALSVILCVAGVAF